MCANKMCCRSRDVISSVKDCTCSLFVVMPKIYDSICVFTKQLTLPSVQVFTLLKTLPRAINMYTALVEDLAVRYTRTSLATCAKGNCGSHLFESLNGLLC